MIAVASAGGHWIQLKRLAPALPPDTIWVSTSPGHRDVVAPARFFRVPDANRWNKLGLAWSAIRIAGLVLSLRPTHVITTGAAPGWLMLVLARMMGARALWIDSIANAEQLSMSGMKARRWANRVWTQWPDLVQDASSDGVAVEHHGSVL